MSCIIESPKGSCPCNIIKSNEINTNNGIPTNMSVPSCQYRQYNLRRNPIFNTTLEPKENLPNSTYRWNVDGINTIEMSQYNPDFTQVKCGKKNHPCNDNVYIADDARLFDSLRNSLIKLDRPPYRSTSFQENNRVPTEDYYSIYDKKFTDYGKNYKTYSDINTGQITYYNDLSINDAYFRPNFTIPSQIDGVLYRDPMGSIKPVYVRKTVLAPNEKYNPLSSIRDSNVYREDILAGQMSQINQSRWSPRWTNNKNGYNTKTKKK